MRGKMLVGEWMMREEESSAKEKSLSATIDTDVLCFDCRYNLRGLDPVANCPECGLSSQFTLEAIAALHTVSPLPLWKSNPRWLNDLSIGLGAALCQFALQVTVACIPSQIIQTKPERLIIFGVSGCAIWAMSLLSAWKLGAKENALMGNRAGTTGLRCFAVASLIFPLLVALSFWYTFNAWMLFPFLATLGAICIASLLFYLRLRDLFGRLDQPLLQVQSTFLMWIGFIWVFINTLIPSLGRPDSAMRLLKIPTLQFGSPASTHEFVRSWRYRTPDVLDVLPFAAQLWAVCLIAIAFVLVWRARRRALVHRFNPGDASGNNSSNSQT